MSVLRTIESKLESLFEGVFGRAFRTNVQPVELARKLVKEMDDHRTVSVSRVYVPNE
jgi:FHA domain-containing protein